MNSKNEKYDEGDVTEKTQTGDQDDRNPPTENIPIIFQPQREGLGFFVGDR
jgi:hypothetical protein